MYKKQAFCVPSSDGIHTLNGVVYLPEGEIRGLFHLVHGMTEYIGRYEHLLSFLASAGMLAFGYDNLGHGGTVKDDGELGFIAHENGHEALVRDVKVFEDAVIKEYGNKPLFLMGHSMGSFIARLAAEKAPEAYAGLIICGTGGPLAASPVGLLFTDIIKKIYGENHISPFAESLAFGAYNKRFEGISKYDWITTDRAVIQKYEADKLCTFHFTVSALHDLIKLNSLCNRRAWFTSLKKEMPVLLISGKEDPVGNYGKGVEKVYALLQAAGMKDLKIKLFDGCRHEIHNDFCAKEMFEEIKTFVYK